MDVVPGWALFMEHRKNRVLRFVAFIILFMILLGCVEAFLFNAPQRDKKIQTAGAVEYFESVSNVGIKDLCVSGEGWVSYTGNAEKADICLTLKTGGAAQLENRFKESGHGILRVSGRLPGLDGYRFSDKLHNDDILGWYVIFQTINKPFGVRTSEETLIYITRDAGGIEHVYIFR